MISYTYANMLDKLGAKKINALHGSFQDICNGARDKRVNPEEFDETEFLRNMDRKNLAVQTSIASETELLPAPNFAGTSRQEAQIIAPTTNRRKEWSIWAVSG